MIDVQNLTKLFFLPGGRELTAVAGVSFSVGAGEVYGLLGPNGAGKTTTLRMLLGLLKPTSGFAAIAGFRSVDFPDEVKRRVGFVSANAGLYQYLTSREMLLFFADVYGLSRETALVELEHLTDLLNLGEFLDQPCSTLSTGQRQRVHLARALIHRPPVMLLDEPTLGLDVLGTQMMTKFIAHLRAQGKAVIVCTHHLDEAERICSRFGLMHKGAIVVDGTLDDMRAQTGCGSLVEIFLKLSVAGQLIAGGGARGG